MIRRIQRWWKFEGKYYHKDIYRGIKNIFYILFLIERIDRISNICIFYPIFKGLVSIT